MDIIGAETTLGSRPRSAGKDAVSADPGKEYHTIAIKLGIA